MADRPETLEETQARLARVPQGGTPPQPPSVSVPITPVPPQPGTPYGPSAPGAADFSQVGGAADFGTMPVRPDPYAANAFPQLQPAVALAPTPTRRPFAVAAIALGVVALVVTAAVVAYFALAYAGESTEDPVFGGDEPEYSEEWQQFPGVSWADPSEALEQGSYEEVSAQLDALAAEFRDELTAELGLVWTETYGKYDGHESNGYGGESMLYYYDAGSWQGQVQLDDPGARQRILDIFTALSASNGGEGVFLRNEVYSDDPVASRADFGAEQLEQQALWSFVDWFPTLADATLSVDVIDRGIPVDPSFDGDYMFTYDESSDTLWVSFYAYAGGLLKEADREAFEDALEPYHGDYEP